MRAIARDAPRKADQCLHDVLGLAIEAVLCEGCADAGAVRGQGQVAVVVELQKHEWETFYLFC
eukprot:762813-Hanusia_phi.AAC.2